PIGKTSCVPRSLSPKRLGDINVDQHHSRISDDVGRPKEIAVVGMACRFPKADSVEEFWQLISSGEAAVSQLPIERFNPEEINRKPKPEQFWGNFLEQPDVFDHRFFGISGREAKSMDPQQRLALQVAYEALESSGHFNSPTAQKTTDVGCYFGVGSVDYEGNVASENASAFSAIGTLRAFITGRISHFFGWSGPSITFDTACSSSAVAIHMACKALVTNECSMALAGGVNIITSPDLHQNLSAASFLNPDGASRAFDVGAGGYCRGEGTGILVLKPLQEAVANGDHIIGVIAGSAVNQGSNCSPITVPDSQSQSELYRRALSIGNLDPKNVTYVEAHGTGTSVGDPIEYKSVQLALFGTGREEDLFLGSVKDNIGHAEAASGVAGVIKTLLMIQHKTIPKQANFTSLNPRIKNSISDQIRIPKDTQPWISKLYVALVNNYGAAGSNTSLAIRTHKDTLFSSEEALGELRNPSFHTTYPILLSAKSTDSLRKYIAALRTYLLKDDVSFGDVAYNIARKRNISFESRATFVAADKDNFFSATDDSFTMVDAALTRTGNSPVVLCFGGQTGRSVTISRSLYVDSDLLRNHLLAALCIADSISVKDAFRLISGRASLVKDSWGPDCGVMLSVECNHEELEATLDAVNSRHDLCVNVACYNGPRSFVLAGDEPSIRNAEQECQRFKSVRLQSTHAYHSYLTDDILSGLEQVANSIDIKAPRIHVETCSRYRSWAEFTAEAIVQHTRQPVYFNDAVCRIAERLPSAVWLEAGSATPIIPMARGILRSDKQATFIPTDLGNTTATANLAKATCQIWEAGLPAQYWLFHHFSSRRFRYLNLPPYQFDKTRHWIQYKPNTDSLSGPSSYSPNIRGSDLVNRVESEDAGREYLFRVQTSNTLFDFAARGHAVAGQSLCPASMYMEMAARCASSFSGSIPAARRLPRVERLSISSPLGLNKAMVFLRLHEISNEVWDFVVFSQSSMDKERENSETEHAKGRISLVDAQSILSEARLSLLKKFIRSARLDKILDSSSSAKISGPTVYQLFSEVVEYADYYRGVKNLAALESESVGLVTAPKGQHLEHDTALCDPICLDNFLQIAGIHTNCLGSRESSEVYMCTTVDEIIFSAAFLANKSGSRSWTVYSRYDKNSKGILVHDIFVFDEGSKDLVLAINGATFRSVPIKSLKRSLIKINSTVTNTSNSEGDMLQDSGYQTKVPSPRNDRYEEDFNGDHFLLDPHETPSVGNELRKREEYNELDQLENRIQSMQEMLGEIIEIPVREIEPTSKMDDLGIDCLLVTEVLSEIQKKFQISLSQAQFQECSDVVSLCRLIESKGPIESAGNATALSKENNNREKNLDSGGIKDISGIGSHGAKKDIQTDVVLAKISCECFNKIQATYDTYAQSTGFAGFCEDVLPLQSELVVQYVVVAFASLGCDLQTMDLEDQVFAAQCSPRHDKLNLQLCKVLEEAKLIKRAEDGTFRRTAVPTPTDSTSSLYATLLSKFPKHASETKLLHTTGYRLAECLSGALDPLALIFRDSVARALVEDVYTNAPMFKTGTLLLSQYLSAILKRLDGIREVRILELGAGTGGTTKSLLEELNKLGPKYKFSYTFTDISSSLVAAAKKKFAKWAFMDYTVLDIEKDPDTQSLGAYDLILSTNCIHATTDLVQSTANIRKMLRPDGVLCLVELTRNLFWFDLVFGLLEGWWRFKDSRKHALASEQSWRQSLNTAGYNWVDWSDTLSQESDILRVITASPYEMTPSVTANKVADTSSAIRSNDMDELRETLTFKEIDGVHIHADIYYPKRLVDPEKDLPVALMIHGGGHVMLSRNDIRPEQTRLLLQSGFLPVSIDYRLCPEITLIEGPITDVADALAWVRNKLPKLQLARADVRVNAEKVVCIGWSTGGNLAMSTVWASIPRDVRPPEAVLVFYCPTDYEDRFWTRPNIPAGSETTDTKNHTASYNLDEKIWVGVQDRPITSYNVPSSNRALGGWMVSGDPRSRLALYMNWHGRTLHVLLNGLDKQSRGEPQAPTQAEIEAISPLAHIRSGHYTTPTFIIHPRQDDLIPWKQAERTFVALRDREIDAGLRIIDDVPHLFDVYRRWQENRDAWEAVIEGYEFLCRHVGLALRDRSA
ncbi:MAG: hypothetical protein Q9165_007030, partial [Trypethelium subeluteriae]